MPPRSKPAAALPLDLTLLKPGMRLTVGLSGGADSVALLRALHERRAELGLVLCAAHLHHGLRGAEADADLAFCRDLAARLELPFHEHRIDIPAEAQANPAAGKAAETLEEAARRLRYAWFRSLMERKATADPSSPPLRGCAQEDSGMGMDAVATAHTLDDQAETVLAKFLRGAWTEGLSGISPQLEFPEGLIVRPLLGATRAQVEAYLHSLHQPWREDSSNRHLTFTRNRIRHELLPQLEQWNPRLREHLVQMAALARDEEAWWQAELARIAPQLILTGRPVRGGGRASASGLALDVSRFAALAPALQRRLLRHAAGLLGAAPDFPATESLRDLALTGRSGQRCELAGLHAERTPRELRLEPAASAPGPEIPEYRIPVPGQIDAPAFGLRLRLATSGLPAESNLQTNHAGPTAVLRTWTPGDRVRLRHSSAPRKVKEILERLRITGSARAVWPVLELDGRIVWMKGVELEPEAGLTVQVELLENIG
ncbi:MAG: tRNA lysidine(34) synthetase TilS [Acidobacteriota bacterium]